MRVLIIAPGAADLASQADEAAGIVRDLPGAYPLWGEVRERDILEAISGAPFDGLIVSGHAGADGRIALADGELSPASLAAYAARTGAGWIVLSTCYGEATITELLQATGADILAATAEIEDRAAWRITRMIAQEIGRAGDLRAAVARMTPGTIAPMRFYANHKRRPAPTADHESMAEQHRTEEMLDAIRRELSILAGKVALLEYQMSQQLARPVSNPALVWAIISGTVAIATVIFLALLIYLIRPAL